jgi:hypothetical protein
MPTHSLDDALRDVELMLNPSLDEAEKSRLAVEVYKARMIHDGLLTIAENLELLRQR